MPNDRLVDRLARELKPVRRQTVTGDALLFAMLCAIELDLFLGLGMMRADMPMAMEQPSFWWKLGSLGLIALVGASVAIVSFNPVESPRRGLRRLVAIALFCLAIGWAVDASRDGLPVLATRLNWRDGLQCMYKMVLLSIPAMIVLALLMRRGAPTDIAGTSLAAGVAAAAWGAFVFVFACPYDDPLYIAVWYAVGCGLVTAFGRLVLPRLARW
jgi:hypothetical protein